MSIYLKGDDWYHRMLSKEELNAFEEIMNKPDLWETEVYQPQSSIIFSGDDQEE